jgi:hypothetical protein
MMKLTLKELRELVRSTLAEAYDKRLIDDESFNKQSYVVPDEIKDKIRRYITDMRL